MSLVIIEPVLGTAVAAVIGLEVPASTKRKFTKCLAYNSTVAAVPIKVYLVPAGLAADTTHCYVDYDLQPRESYNCPEIVGAALNAGGTLEVLGLGVSFSAVASDISNS